MDKTKTQGEITTEVRRTTLLKNNVIIVEHFSALTIYNHQSCPAWDKFFAKCAKLGRFARVGCSDRVKFLQNNNIDASRNDNESQPHENEINDPVAFAEFTSHNGWEELYNYSMMAMADAPNKR